ncbi:MAG: hypothetical protein PHX51_06430, partial [Clostridia bacterium]|nr:hypothetical protein [Clostridia bacterium]
MKIKRILLLILIMAVLCVSLTACFKEPTRVYYTVTFYDGNGELVGTKTVIRNGSVETIGGLTWKQEIGESGNYRVVYCDTWLDENGNKATLKNVKSDISLYAANSMMTKADVSIYDCDGSLLKSYDNIYIGDLLWDIEYNGIAAADDEDPLKFKWWNVKTGGVMTEQVNLSTTMVVGDLDIYAICANFYDVTIVDLDGNILYEGEVEEGTPISDLVKQEDVPVYEEEYPYYDEGGYDFDWRDAEDKPVVGIEKGGVITPVLTIKKYSVKFSFAKDLSASIEFLVEHGYKFSEDAQNTLVGNAKYGAPEGYKFIEWADNTVYQNVLANGVKKDLSFSARYEIHQFDVVYYNYKGELIATTYGVKYGDNITMHANAVSSLNKCIRTGFDFVCWTKDGVAIDTTSAKCPIDQDVLYVYAKYEAHTVTVVYEIMNTYVVPPVYTVWKTIPDQKYDIVLASPRAVLDNADETIIDAEGLEYYFAGWAYAYDEATKTITFTAKYSNEKHYIVSFIYNGKLVYAQTVIYNSKDAKLAADAGEEYNVYAIEPFANGLLSEKSAMLAEIRPSGKTFDYWCYTNAQGEVVPYEFTTPIENNMTLTAVFKDYEEPEEPDPEEPTANPFDVLPDTMTMEYTQISTRNSDGVVVLTVYNKLYVTETSVYYEQRLAAYGAEVVTNAVYYEKIGAKWHSWMSSSTPVSLTYVGVYKEEDVYVSVNAILEKMYLKFFTDKTFVEDVTLLGRECAKYTAKHNGIDYTIIVDKQTEMVLSYSATEVAGTLTTITADKFELAKTDVERPDPTAIVNPMDKFPTTLKMTYKQEVKMSGMAISTTSYAIEITANSFYCEMSITASGVSAVSINFFELKNGEWRYYNSTTTRADLVDKGVYEEASVFSAFKTYTKGLLLEDYSDAVETDTADLLGRSCKTYTATLDGNSYTLTVDTETGIV